jgi:hypothetical protein
LKPGDLVIAKVVEEHDNEAMNLENTIFARYAG